VLGDRRERARPRGHGRAVVGGDRWSPAGDRPRPGHVAIAAGRLHDVLARPGRASLPGRPLGVGRSRGGPPAESGRHDRAGRPAGLGRGPGLGVRRVRRRAGGHALRTLRRRVAGWPRANLTAGPVAPPTSAC
jgi:hypothetical protein